MLTALVCALLTLPAFADSQVRIVRLSDVHGSVLIDKNAGAGFERAFLNLPITQGVQIQTRADGRAEIEFEDGSTLRIAPDTKIQFGTLNVNEAGKRVSVVNLDQGMAYVNWTDKSDTFTMKFANESVDLDHPAHFRVETSPSTSRLAVFKGDVEVAGAPGKVTVSKKKMAIFEADDNYKLAKLEEAPLDSWDKEAADYHQAYVSKNNSSPYGYGYSDLGYYGSFQTLPGYGLMWQPYFTGVGWDPFMDGAWSFYPGFGFMYASAYPWGWLPYHYGNWIMVPGFGWMWQPGYWNSWVGIPRYTGTLLHPLVPPTGTVHTVTFGRTGTAAANTGSAAVVSKGSAGLGIARGSVGDLGHLNKEVAKSGFAHVQSSPQFAATRSGGSYSAPSHGAVGTAGHSATVSSGGARSSGASVHR